MPEIIGEKIDEDVIHPCQFITNDIIITNPLIGHCHGISLVLTNDNMNAKLSENYGLFEEFSDNRKFFKQFLISLSIPLPVPFRSITSYVLYCTF